MNEVKRSGESKTQHLEVILEFGHSSTLRDVPKVCWDYTAPKWVSFLGDPGLLRDLNHFVCLLGLILLEKSLFT